MDEHVANVAHSLILLKGAPISALVALHNCPAGLTLTELVQCTGYSRRSVLNACILLKSEGYVQDIGPLAWVRVKQ